MKKNKNISGDGLIAQKANWNFSGKVADNFYQHVSNSVPLYEMGHDLICEISEYFIKSDSICYDIGCSSGELSVKLANKHKIQKGCRIYGVDREKDMIIKAKKSQPKSLKNLSYINNDLINIKLKPADLIVSYYTIMFSREYQRQLLINKVYEALRWGGGFLFFEKVRAPDARFQDMMTRLYDDFKLSKGYVADEIVNKSRSLKGILNPFSTTANIDLLKRAGFKDIMTVMKYVTFEGFLAIK